MTREIINRGTTANDGTGDTLRVAMGKANANFRELWITLFGDSAATASGVQLQSNTIVFEGASIDAFETTLAAVNPTADRSVLLPNASGIIVLQDVTETISNKKLKNSSLSTVRIWGRDSDHYYQIVTGALTGNRNLNIPLLADSDTFALVTKTQTLLNKTLISATLTSPMINNFIVDVNGNEIIQIDQTPGAVNYIRVQNGATGAGVWVRAAGDDSDVPLYLAGKGDGSISMRSRVNLATETLNVSGAVSLAVPMSIFTATGARVYSVPDGIAAGDTKRLVNIGTGEARVVPSVFPRGARLTLKQNAAIDLVWTTPAGWEPIGMASNGDSTSPYAFII